MAKGRPYEILTSEAFQAILDQSPMRGVKVEHDITLKGKDTPTHQIDVYWKFEIAGITYQSVTQAKDWKKRVPQVELHAFKTVLEDIPGQPRGIFVARQGYQRGAKAFAKTNGILLFQLEEVHHDGPLSLSCTTLGYVHVRMRRTPLFILGVGTAGYSPVTVATIFEPEFRDSRFHIDPKWLSEKYGLSVHEAKQRVMRLRLHGIPNEFRFYNSEKIEIGTLHQVYKDFVQQLRGKIGKPHRLCYRPEGETLLRTADPNLPFVRFHSITSTVTVTKKRRVERPWPLPNLALRVLRNLSEGTVWLVGKRLSTAERCHGQTAAPA